MQKEKISFESEVEEYLGMKKPATADVYRYGFAKFLEYYRVKYGDDTNLHHFLLRIQTELQKPLLEQERITEMELKEFIDYLKNQKLSNNAIRLYFAAIQNFLKYKHIVLSGSFVELPPQVGKRDGNKKVNGKHKWTIEQIKQFVDVAPNYREKALIMCMFQSGLAVNEICRLNYEDVQDELEAGILPLCLDDLIRKKTNIEFRSFFGRDAVKYLKLYLATRNNLHPKSPLFVQDRLRNDKEIRITISIIEQAFRDISDNLDFIKKNGGYNPARPHSLRAAFNSRLTGMVNDDLREFWMGHSIGGVKRAYLNMPIEDMRKHYMNAERYLKIEMTSQEEKEEKAAITQSIAPEMREKVDELHQTIGQQATELRQVREQLGETVIEVKKFGNIIDKFFNMDSEALWNLMEKIDKDFVERKQIELQQKFEMEQFDLEKQKQTEKPEQLNQAKKVWEEEKIR
jgi:integrase